jgi:hypothetical protein
MSGAAFVPVCMKVHGGPPACWGPHSISNCRNSSLAGFRIAASPILQGAGERHLCRGGRYNPLDGLNQGLFHTGTVVRFHGDAD